MSRMGRHAPPSYRVRSLLLVRFYQDENPLSWRVTRSEGELPGAGKRQQKGGAVYRRVSTSDQDDRPGRGLLGYAEPANFEAVDVFDGTLSGIFPRSYSIPGG